MMSLHDLRQRIIVPQDAVNFSSSAGNICYGRPDANDDEVKAAAQAAFAHDHQHPARGLQHLSGASGCALSGTAPAHRHCPRHAENPPLLRRTRRRAPLTLRANVMVQPLRVRHARPHDAIIAHRLATVQKKADHIVVLTTATGTRHHVPSWLQ
jgi:ATP-binding cassette subfamily B protein